MIKLLLLLALTQGTLQSVSNYNFNSNHLNPLSQPQRQHAHHPRPQRYDSEWMKYMIGEKFFKENDNRGTEQNFEDDDSEDDIEEIPYSVLERYNVRIILKYL